MAKKRHWGRWPKQAKEELNGISGLAGVGGTVIGIGGLTLLAGPAALVCAVLGGTITVGAVGYALVKAVPPRLKSPEDLVGQTVPLKELESVLPIRTLSIIGPTQAGKTTLRNRLAFKSGPVSRTQEMTAYITSLQTAPPTYLAVLDGGGEKFPQQFNLVEVCDCLCIVIDHNRSDSDSTISQKRVEEHQFFLEQIVNQLNHANVKPKLWVQFLINKHDLWKSATAQQLASFDSFYQDQVKEWRKANRGQTVDSRPHSNEDADDIAEFMNLLKQTTQSK